MAGAKNHDYHILPPDIWPLMGALSALVMTSGGVLFMHKITGGTQIMLLGLLGVILTMFSWWGKVIKEAHAGDHTPVVQLHQRYGMILFIASEVMFFVGWFWAFFDFSLFPSKINTDVIGGVWPPKAIEAVINAFDLPLLNTLILLCSGTTLTWAHHALIHGDRKSLKQGLAATILLGLLFTSIQAYEYVHAPFGFGQNTYGSAFFMATGFHGFHVIIGTIFLIVCWIRAERGEFTPRQHFGLEAAAWYWHFVDVVWLFLFVAIYVWGNWGAVVE
ncbi:MULTISPECIES: cytochrome c oxidase subunit 3 [unclassified Novosphingobium]|uniref:cytochrome c oxidase subunit 3 n=1 Tax=Novosphingobium TaxID=165696 RepID=UPI001446B818|nr:MULTISPECIES: cytochrome c oxidase subunit 3 [unclassified Novosphingobium]NKJ40563.1 cytochrome c oxidase subunit 3 [Novosphingobium sp. SG720]NMN02859.1 cytochrome c oxidase subunit 3 [Novosphingobium sp. SG919]NMN87154.1 cytochrome c oxidase subunit 3 [Novosphingobium sp. SG916]